MSRDELAVMDGAKCILQVRGVRPFLSDKFDITKHRRYPLLADCDKRNTFDFASYMKCGLRIGLDETIEVFDCRNTENQ